jgi:hypothetical protein
MSYMHMASILRIPTEDSIHQDLHDKIDIKGIPNFGVGIQHVYGCGKRRNYRERTRGFESKKWTSQKNGNKLGARQGVAAGVSTRGLPSWITIATAPVV